MTHRPFARLAGGATISGLGDGVTQVAGALLTLSLTHSPLLVAGLLAAQQLPWALGALPAGALVDRVDRRRAMAAASLVRAAALGTLGLLAAAGRAGLPVLSSRACEPGPKVGLTPPRSAAGPDINGGA